MSKFKLLTFAVFLVLAFSMVLFAQEKKPATMPEKKAEMAVKGEEHHHATSAYLHGAIEHAQMLHHWAMTTGDKMNLEVARKHNDEIGHNLQEAQANLEKAQMPASEAQKTKAAAQHEALNKALAQATDDYNALKAELAKEKPDLAVVKAKSADLYQGLQSAETQHQAMKKTQGVKEPSSQEQPKKS